MNRKKHNSHKNDFWIGFSDLMTGLMLVFIILSITFMALAKQKIDEIDKQKKNIIIIMSEKLNMNNIKVEYDKEKGTVTISQDILFESRKPDLNDEGKKFIKLFAKILRDNIFASSQKDEKAGDSQTNYASLIKYIHIEGYASKDGPVEENFRLSFERSMNVWKHMVGDNFLDQNVMTSKLNIVSRGEIDANQNIIDEQDRKVIFRFEFYDTYNKIFDGLSK